MAVKSIFRHGRRNTRLKISAPTPVQVHKPTSFATKEIRFVNPELQPEARTNGLQRQKTLARRAERQGTLNERKTNSVRDSLRLAFIRLRQLVRQTIRQQQIMRRNTLRKKDIVHTTADAVRRISSTNSLRRSVSSATLRRQQSTRKLHRQPSSKRGIMKSKTKSRRQYRDKSFTKMEALNDIDEYNSGSLEFRFTKKDIMRLHPKGAAKTSAPTKKKEISFCADPEMLQQRALLTPPDSPRHADELEEPVAVGDDLSLRLGTFPKVNQKHTPQTPPSEFDINSEDIYNRKYPSGVGQADDDSIEVTSTIGSATIEQIHLMFQGFDYDYRDKIEKKLELISHRLQQFDAGMVNRGTQTTQTTPSLDADSVMSDQIEAVLYDISQDSGPSYESMDSVTRDQAFAPSRARNIGLAVGDSSEESKRRSSTYYSFKHDSDTDSYASFSASSSGSSSYESVVPSHAVSAYEGSSSPHRNMSDEETTPLLLQEEILTSSRMSLNRHRKTSSESSIATTASSVHSRRAIPTTHNMPALSFNNSATETGTLLGSTAKRLPPRRVISSVSQSRESLYLSDTAPSPESAPDSGAHGHPNNVLPTVKYSPPQHLRVNGPSRQVSNHSRGASKGSIDSIEAIGVIGGESSWLKSPPRPLPPVPVLSPVLKKRELVAPSHPPPLPPKMDSLTPLARVSHEGERPVPVPTSKNKRGTDNTDSSSDTNNSDGSLSRNSSPPPSTSDEVLQRMYRELEELQQRSVQLSDMVARTEQGALVSDTESNRHSQYLSRDSLASIATPATPNFPSSFQTEHNQASTSIPTTSHTSFSPISRGGVNRRRVRNSALLDPSLTRVQSPKTSEQTKTPTAPRPSSLGLTDIPIPSPVSAPRYLVPPAEPSDVNIMEWKDAIKPPFVRGPSVTRGKRLSISSSLKLEYSKSQLSETDEDCGFNVKAESS